MDLQNLPREKLEKIKQLLDVPMVATAIANSFFDSIAGAKRQN